MRAIETRLTNESENYLLCEPLFEPLADTILGEGATMGEIYRFAQREYGRCTSKVYVDRDGQPPLEVGWFFVKRQRYEDTHEPYLQGAWITVGTLVPAVPARLSYKPEIKE